ncbi:glycosyl hydrolase [Opitutaceae bacterium EW11]|nr:glycosyl hydrolase [Opitutaceae bacterium EW11]
MIVFRLPRLLRSFGLLAVVCMSTVPLVRAAGEATYVSFAPVDGGIALVADGRLAPLWVDAADFPGVIRAVGDLQSDVERVTGKRLRVVHRQPPGAPEIVIVGTLEKSPLLAQLVQAGKLDVSAIRGKWESWVSEVVSAPFPGIDRALVIAGSDKRGAIYGVYSLSEQIGVSPWYWWADSVPTHRDALFVQPGRRVQGEPSVKYRGIFLNDEAPDLTRWVAAKYGAVTPEMNPHAPPGVANYGREFYRRIFEVILRLRGNYLWPAMWNNAFNEDDPENARLADEYGVVMGTSHQEPMLRAQKEWDWRYFKQVGTWNYSTHPLLLEDFWREGVRRNKAYESIVTIGLRGANDTEMAPGGPKENMALLQKIVARQREILAQEVNPDVARIPQLWCLYKEVQDFYEEGMTVPDDVTLLWAEDNWGNVRRLPTAEERKRSGGAGVYYHFDYHGGPRSYQWLNTTQLPKIWDQLSLAKQYGADRIWIVNVGHFRGYELPLEFFMDLAWNTGRWTGGNLGEYTRLWAEREFGPGHAAEIADILSKYCKYNARRKPELLAPDTYSLSDYDEAERVVSDYDAIAARAEKLAAALPAEKRDAFFQLVLFPTKASALVNALYLAAAKNALYARQGRASAADFARRTRELFKQDLDLMRYYDNDYAGGRWKHFMDQTHLGYTSWRDPEENSLRAIPLVDPVAPDEPALGVAVTGSEAAWPGEKTPASIPRFDVFNRQRQWIDVFNRGKGTLAFSAKTNVPWIQLSSDRGTLAKDQRLWVSIDWAQAPQGLAHGVVTIAGGGARVAVNLEAFKPAELAPEALRGFVEGEGVVAIEAEHFDRNVAAGALSWQRIEDYGHTLSGMRASAPADAPSVTPGSGAPCLEYRAYLFSTGTFELTAVVAPTLNFMAGRPLQVAFSVDDQTPQTATLVPAGYRAQNGNADWEKTVANNFRLAVTKHVFSSPGYHTLKVWMVDPGVVVQKLILNTGGLRPSYLGPQESYRGEAH